MTTLERERLKELQEHSERVLRDAEDEQQRIADVLERVERSRQRTDNVLRRHGYLK